MKNLKPSLDRPVLPDTHALPSPEPPGGHSRRRWFEKRYPIELRRLAEIAEDLA